MRACINLCCLASFVILSPSAKATETSRTGAIQPASTGSTTASTGTKAATESTGNSASNGAAMAIPSMAQAASQPNINNSASQGQTSQLASAGVSLVVAGGLYALYESDPTKFSWAAPMAAMAALQAVQTGISAALSGKTKNATAPGGGMNFTNNPGGTNDTNNDNTTPGPTNTDTKVDPIELVKDGTQTLNNLASKGFTIDKTTGTITAPDGSKKSSKDFATPQAMAAAGFSPGAIEMASAAVDKLTKEGMAKYGAVDSPRVVAMGVETGGGAGYSGDSGNHPSFDSYFKGLRGLSSADRARMVAGKSVIAGGAPIGVKGDDIFQMISRRYASKRSGNEFIEIAENRVPAGLAPGLAAQRGFHMPAKAQRPAFVPRR